MVIPQIVGYGKKEGEKEGKGTIAPR